MIRFTRFVYVGLFTGLLAACGGGDEADTNPPGGGTAGISSVPTLALGNQNIGTTGTAASITVTNSGTAPLNISGIQVTGSFTIGGNCSGQVAPQATCTLTVTFAPTAGGAATGVITIASNAPGSSHTISVSGTGVVAHPASQSRGTKSSVAFMRRFNRVVGREARRPRDSA